MMLPMECFKHVLGYFPRDLWRLTWSLLRRQTRPGARGELSARAGFAVRSPEPAIVEIPASIDPGVAAELRNEPRLLAAVQENVDRARERFRTGIDLRELADIAERGSVLHALVLEQSPQQADCVHLLSVYPRGGR